MITFLLTTVLLASLCVGKSIIPQPYDDILEPPTSRPYALGNSKWPNGVIPYTISHPRIRRDILEQAMRHISGRTCIKFVPRTTQSDYVNIVEGNGCTSYVGRIRGRQELSLGANCQYFGIVVHELIHAIGFHHMHNKYDRENYVKVLMENVTPGLEHAFHKLSRGDPRQFKIFDFNSIMIYDEKAFARRPGLKTILPRKSDIRLVPAYAKSSMTSLDARGINQLYNCPL